MSWWKWDLAEQECVARGCCFSEPLELGNEKKTNGTSLLPEVWCYYPTRKEEITQVHVVQGCHIDVGFMNTAPAIINLWFHHHFPLAAQVGAALARMGHPGGAGLRFTSPAWLVSLYLDCPQPYVREGVVCPNASDVETFEEAVEQGWITWYAFPFDTEAETMDPSLVEFAVDLSHQLDDRFAQPRKQVVSQRDVPGITRSAIPILAARGVTAISVGVNGGSAPPNVPKAFLWQDPISGQRLTAFWLQGGYSGIQLPHDPFLVYTMVPNSSTVMVVAWRGDNAGPPPNAQNVLDTWFWLSKEFPNAKIIDSTFDGFVGSVPSTAIAQLPIITSEIGDTWIFGIASDPVKLAKFRIATALRSSCLASGQCDPSDPHIWQFSRLLLKGAEHTWGLDQKKAIAPYIASNWSNADLQALLPTPSFESFVESWYRQRRMALSDALELLSPHPLFFEIEAAFKREMAVPPPAPLGQGWDSFSPQQLPSSFALPDGGTIAFDRSTGAISGLTLRSVVYAAPTSPLALLQYTTYDEADYLRYAEEYNYLFPVIIDKYDQMKLNIDKDGAVHADTSPTLLRVAASPCNTSFSLQLSFPRSQVLLAGAPQTAWLHVQLQGGALNITATFHNKTATRLPEAMFLRFAPPLLPPDFQAASWSADKLGEWIDPADVVIGGAKRLHSVGSGISFAERIFIHPVHSPLVCFGTPTAFPTPLTKSPDWEDGASFILWDNTWNTNYPQWTIDQEFVFRFQLSFD